LAKKAIDWRSKVARGVHMTALFKAVLFLQEAAKANTRFTPSDLLTPGSMYSSARQWPGVMYCLPVAIKDIHGYTSWLAKDGKTGQFYVMMDTSVYQEVLASARLKGRRKKRVGSKFLALMGHEIGHVVMGHAQHGMSAGSSSRHPLLRPMDRDEEWEAWMFAECLRGLAFADVSGASEPDDVPAYV